MSLILPANSLAVGGYNIDNSLRFNSGSSDYLSRTPASTTDTKTWTWSGWVKLAKTGVNPWLFGAYSSGSLNTKIYLDSNNNLNVHTENSTVYRVQTDAVLRDFSAWYHIVVAFDTTQATESNRIKIYINGTQQSLTEEASGYPTQNWDSIVNNSSYAHNMGYEPELSTYFDGYIAEAVFIDGQALDQTSFGEFDEDTGIWKPKAYTGSYGTNGFYLDFENSGSLGADQSGNGNNFTVNNLTSIDQVTDTPTNNFCTWNSLEYEQYKGTYSDGNLTNVTPELGGTSLRGTFEMPQTGKWFYEAKIVSATYTPIGDNARIGIATGSVNPVGYDARYLSNGNSSLNGSSSAYGATYTVGDIIGVAVDADGNTITFYKNGSSQGSLSYTMVSGETYKPYISENSNGLGLTISANFGNPPYSANGYTDDAGYGNFSYAVPSGYYSLCTKNLSEFG